ncbi:efflux RND transporter periplasmic adaptor subunit [Colwellia psychrerythraea]|uniref:Efflux transporter, RND family, MFP subunit n=1 Tax=Colwellia psychrerythraea (strain 34H / ATCC BAA-681) TaxID=167879 RepID=Q47U51_COLP3|nr:efflux RND transporter periplasmic adaptor subunit [Colwellia psychrerythraea]AAZ26282.1 efflux transporter, RND family, MFP subunit [Colwellia psychrerythraea 34H]
MKPRLFRLLSVLCFTSLFLNAPIYAQELETKIIKAEPIVKKINRTGKLTFKRTLNLSFKSSGYLEELTIDEGDSFIKGQLLAQLDSEELTAEKNASYARLLQAKREIKRIKTLLSKKLSSQQALDDAITSVETTRARHKIAQYNLTKAQLIAPFDGVVLARYTDLGELQSPSQSALKIAAVENNLVVRVALTASEVNLVNLQQRIDLNLTQYGLVTGTVSKVPAIADQQSHLFTIEVLLENLKVNQVVVGQLVHVLAEVMTDTFSYRLPLEALNSVDNQGKALVMVLDTNATETKNYRQQEFLIKQLSNEYIYLSAQPSSPPLTIVTRGWQHLALIENKP